MRLVDYLTIAAIAIGPISAVLIQLYFERRREIRRNKFAVLSTFMAYRRRLIMPEAVGALNTVALVFNDDNSVIEKHRELMAEMERERTLPPGPEKDASTARRDDLTIELITCMATAMGYKFSHSLIKTHAYLPQGYLNEEAYTEKVRASVTSLLDGTRPLHVRLTEEQLPPDED